MKSKLYLLSLVCLDSLVVFYAACTFTFSQNLQVLVGEALGLLSSSMTLICELGKSSH